MIKKSKKQLRVIIVSLSLLLLFVSACAPSPTTNVIVTPNPTLAVTGQTKPTKIVVTTETALPLLQPSSSPQTNLQTPITSVHMVNDLQGWAMSQTLVMYTKDGGKTWQDITPKDIGVIFSSLSSQAQSTFEITGTFFNAHDAWVAVPQPGKITLSRTEDGGLNWQTIALSTIQSRGSFPVQIISLVFVNPQIGWLLLSMGRSAGQENVELYQTKDSGITWNLVADTGQNAAKGKMTSDGTKTGLGFRDPSEGWLTGSTHGNAVFLYHTMDGGATWDTQSIDLPAGFTATGGSATSYPPIFFDEQRGVIPVYLGNTNPGINLFFFSNHGWWSSLCSDESRHFTNQSIFLVLGGCRTWICC